MSREVLELDVGHVAFPYQIQALAEICLEADFEVFRFRRVFGNSAHIVYLRAQYSSTRHRAQQKMTIILDVWRNVTYCDFMYSTLVSRETVTDIRYGDKEAGFGL
ncbi:MAG TPA: hypothetical protein VFL04_05790, partial [Rectinemataceae bacterium]|nr:hypothetical protein [Rectinemataceae bacterium]